MRVGGGGRGGGGDGGGGGGGGRRRRRRGRCGGFDSGRYGVGHNHLHIKHNEIP